MYTSSYQFRNLPHFGDTITDPGSTIWNRKSTYRLSSSIIWDRQNSHKMFFAVFPFPFFILLQKCGLGTLIMSGICSRLPRMPTLAFKSKSQVNLGDWCLISPITQSFILRTHDSTVLRMVSASFFAGDFRGLKL